jgi:hypothetical protein
LAPYHSGCSRAERIRQTGVVRAYPALTNVTPHAQAYYVLTTRESLLAPGPLQRGGGLCEALAAEFFEAAFQQDVPAFELMFM